MHPPHDYPSAIAALFRAVLQASWQGSLAIALVLLVRRVLGARVPARWHHLLWFLVLARLLVPAVVLPHSRASLENIPALAHPFERPPTVLKHETPAVDLRLAASLPPAPARSDVVGPAPRSVAMPLTPGKSWSPWIWAAWVWLGGVLLLAGWLSACVFRLRARLRGKTIPAEESILAMWRACCQRWLRRTPPRLLLADWVDSPALVGWWRPTLLIPRRSLDCFSAQDWEHVFAHEIAHLRWRDHWSQLLVLAVWCVHWFNPVVWLGLRRLRADRELAADEWALRRLRGDRALAYGETLFKTLAQHSSDPIFQPGMIGIGEDGEQIKQRLRRIAGFLPQRRIVGSLVGFVVVLGLGAVVLGQSSPVPLAAPLPKDATAHEIGTPPSTHGLNGLALTPDNQTVADATVTVIVQDGENWKSWRTQTDAQGTFRLEQLPGKPDEGRVMQVLVQKSGSGLGLAYFFDSPASLVVHLNRSVQLAVQAMAPDGRPIAGLKLWVKWLGWMGYNGPMSELRGDLLSASTDQDGRCVFTDLPANARLMLTHADERYAQPGGTQDWIELSDKAGKNTRTLTLPAAATISGTVHYPGSDGRVAANVMVHAQIYNDLLSTAGNADTRTDAQGQFTFMQMAEGTYDLHCELDEQLEKEWASPSRQCVVKLGQTLAKQDLALTRGAVITGRVSAADGSRRVDHIPVAADLHRDTSYRCFSSGCSPDGQYSMRVAPGKYHVYIATDGLPGYDLPTNDVEVKEGETRTLNLILPAVAATHFVSGRVVDRRGQAVPGAEIVVCVPGEWLSVIPQLADEQGNFRLTMPDAQRWEERRSNSPEYRQVRLFARTEAGLVTAQGVDAKGGAQDVVVELSDHALAQVSGEVTNAAGHPLGNVPVRAYIRLGDLPGSDRVVRTDTQGRFTFDNLWPGLEYSFHAEAESYTREGVNQITLAAGEQRKLPGWQLSLAR